MDIFVFVWGLGVVFTVYSGNGVFVVEVGEILWFCDVVELYLFEGMDEVVWFGVDVVDVEVVREVLL